MRRHKYVRKDKPERRGAGNAHPPADAEEVCKKLFGGFRFEFVLRYEEGGAPARDQSDEQGCRQQNQPDKKAEPALERRKREDECEQRRQNRQPVGYHCRDGYIVFIPREQVRKRLFPLLLGRLRRLGGGDALAAQQLVAGNAVQLGDGGQHGYVGRGCSRLPAAHRFIGNAEPVCGVLLRIALRFSQNCEEFSDCRFCHKFSFAPAPFRGRGVGAPVFSLLFYPIRRSFATSAGGKSLREPWNFSQMRGNGRIIRKKQFLLKTARRQ